MQSMKMSRHAVPSFAGRRIFQGNKGRTLTSNHHQQQYREFNVASTVTGVCAATSTTLMVFYYYYSCCHSSSSSSGRMETKLPRSLNQGRTTTQCDIDDCEPTLPHVGTAVQHYSEAYDPDLDLDSSGYTEEERFYQCVSYHRSLLHDYNRRWGQQQQQQQQQSDATTTSTWPRNVPHTEEVAALECDLFYCQRSPEYHNDIGFCHSTKFRIASYYVSPQNNHDTYTRREKGFRVIKELAEQGYPDAMCLYGILLNEGTIDGVEANPQQAVVWWRRCVDEHGHINSTYEFANACYLGDGIAENAPMAVSLFRRAAHLGHAGAAYMLGECLLNGVGVERDRTDALEWLVTSAELGHRGAQDRVLMILNVHYGSYSAASDAAKQRQLEETIKWIDYDDIANYNPELEPLHKAVSIERRFTIGGGSRNPVVVARRKSIVAESRDDS